jgi:hypothetical protein
MIKGEFFITRHALIRFQEHYPDVGYGEVLKDLRGSVEIEGPMALTLTGRGKKHKDDKPTTYYLSAERVGIYAIVDSSDVAPGQRTVITYLRLGDLQKDFAQKHWPVEKAAI